MSEVRANTISDAAGTGPVTLTKQNAAKAWANFNGTGTIAIRDSQNVSSLTDNGVGDYSVNLTSAMASANYALSTFANWNSGALAGLVTAPSTFAPAVGSVRFNVANSTAGTGADVSHVHAVMHGDLA